MGQEFLVMVWAKELVQMQISYAERTEPADALPRVMVQVYKAITLYKEAVQIRAPFADLTVLVAA